MKKSELDALLEKYKDFPIEITTNGAEQETIPFSELLNTVDDQESKETLLRFMSVKSETTLANGANQ